MGRPRKAYVPRWRGGRGRFVAWRRDDADWLPWAFPRPTVRGPRAVVSREALWVEQRRRAPFHYTIEDAIEEVAVGARDWGPAPCPLEHPAHRPYEVEARRWEPPRQLENVPPVTPAVRVLQTVVLAATVAEMVAHPEEVAAELRGLNSVLEAALARWSGDE